MYIEGGVLACSVLEWCLHACSADPFWNEIIGLERSRQGTSKRLPEPPMKNKVNTRRPTDFSKSCPGLNYVYKVKPFEIDSDYISTRYDIETSVIIPLESPHNLAHVAHTD